MSQRIAYYRVSSSDQTIESQRQALGASFDEEFHDQGVSGSVPALNRPGFARLFEYVRKGDVLHVYSIDRLGRDALDVQATVRALLLKGVALEVHGLGSISKGAGELVLAVLAQIADMERLKIIERTSLGRARAKVLLDTTGKTQNGKIRMGRPEAANAEQVRQWRMEHSASINKTALQFGISTATVKRYCASNLKAI